MSISTAVGVLSVYCSRFSQNGPIPKVVLASTKSLQAHPLRLADLEEPIENRQRESGQDALLAQRAAHSVPGKYEHRTTS